MQSRFARFSMMDQISSKLAWEKTSGKWGNSILWYQKHSAPHNHQAKRVISIDLWTRSQTPISQDAEALRKVIDCSTKSMCSWSTTTSLSIHICPLILPSISLDSAGLYLQWVLPTKFIWKADICLRLAVLIKMDDPGLLQYKKTITIMSILREAVRNK